MDELPDVLEEALARVIAAERKEWDRERERIETDARAAIAELKANTALLMHRVETALVSLKDGEPGLQGEPGPPGKDADVDTILEIVADAVKDAVAALPVAKDGRDGVDGLPGEPGPPGPAGEPGIAGKDGSDGKPGADAVLDFDYINRTISDVVELRRDDLRGEKGDPGEAGEKGERGEVGEQGVAGEIGERGEKGARGEAGEKGDRGEPGPAGRDAADIAGGFVNRNGALILTLSDGRMLDLGEVVGKDGRDGKDGAPGKDGLSFDAFELEPEWDGERTFRIKWSDAKGNAQSREWRLPIMLYREIYKAEASYEAGDTVRYGGSLWLAMADTSEKPGDGSKDWRLIVRAGRDGRDGAPGTKGEKGDRGAPGPARLVTGEA